MTKYPPDCTCRYPRIMAPNTRSGHSLDCDAFLREENAILATRGLPLIQAPPVETLLVRGEWEENRVSRKG